jgi:hypothetical protein
MFVKQLQKTIEDKKMKHPKKQTGIGLIEVLITALVVGLGILAVASLQGKLMGDTGANKARSEAMQLANQKMEQLRDILQISGYNAIATGNEAAVIAGSNESFFRYWIVTNLPYAATTTTPVDCTATAKPADCLGPERKRIQVSVAWPYSAVPTLTSTSPLNPTPNPAPDAEHVVAVQSIIAYDNASYSNRLASNAENPPTLNVGSPTTNAGSSTVIYDSRVVALASSGTPGTISSQTTDVAGQYLKVNSGGNTGSIVYKCTDTGGVDSEGRTYIPFIALDTSLGLYTRRVNNQSAFIGFKEAIELAEYDFTDTNGVLFCVRRVRYNGGVMVPIKGRIYSNLDVSFTTGTGQNTVVNLLGFDASESGVFCKFTPISSLSSTASYPYRCYVGGNCVNGPVGTVKEGSSGVVAAITANVTAAAGENTIVFQCPQVPSGTFTASPVYPANVYADVGPGGWRGNVGLIGLGDSGGNSSLTTCFNPPAVARQYYTLRTNSSVLTNEGINKPYMCHDFLVVTPPNGNSTLDCTSAGDGVTTGVGALNLASNPTVRNLSGTTSNTFDSTIGTGNCHTITGTAPSGTTSLTATSTNGGFDCTLSGLTYTCIGTSKATSVTIATNAGLSCITNLTNTNMSPTGCVPGGASYAVSGRVLADSATSVTFGTGTGSFNPLSTSMLSFGGATCTVSYTSSGGGVYSYNCPSVLEGSIITFVTASGYASVPASLTVSGAAITTPAGDITIKKNRTVSVTVATAGDGTVSGISLTPPSGVTCTGTASPYSCTGLSTWSGTVSASGTCNGIPSTVTGSASVASSATTATITLASCIAPTHSLNVSTTGSGTVTSDDSIINCTSACNSSYSSSSSVTLTATADANFVFTGWTGACSGTGTCTVTMGADRTVGANFVSTSTVYNVTGSISYNGALASDLTAISPASCSFTGGTAKTGYSCSANVGNTLSVTVTFTDGSGSNNRWVCVGGTSMTGPATATIYNSTVLGNTTQNFTLKKGASVSCP